MPEYLKSKIDGMLPDSLDDRSAELLGHDDSPRTHFISFGFELRLDESKDPDRRELTERRQYKSQRNKGDVDRDQINRFPDPGGVDVPDVDLVLHFDPRIFLEFPVQLPFSDIEGVDATGAVLKQAIGKAAR